MTTLTAQRPTGPDLGELPDRPWVLTLATTGTTPYVIAQTICTDRADIERHLPEFREIAASDRTAHNQRVTDYRIGSQEQRQPGDYRLAAVRYQDGDLAESVDYPLTPTA